MTIRQTIKTTPGFLRVRGLLLVIPGRFELPTYRLGGGLNSFFHLFFSTVLSAKTPYPCGFSSFLENNGHKAKLVYFSTYYTQLRFELAKSFAKFSRENHHMNPQYYSKVAIVSGKTHAQGFCSHSTHTIGNTQYK